MYNTIVKPHACVGTLWGQQAIADERSLSFRTDCCATLAQHSWQALLHNPSQTLPPQYTKYE